MNYYIKHIEYYLPNKIIDNDFLFIESGIDKSFTESKVGIKERRIAENDERPSEMAFKAANELIQKHRINKEDIDLILLCTQNPDYRLPTTACLVQDLLGVKKSCISFDINLGCSGFVYSLPIAGNFIKTGMINNALVIMVDQYSKIIDYKDKNTAAIFGDAASAALLSACDDGFGVIDSNFGTDGSGAKNLILYNSGIVQDSEKSNYLFMDGREIFKFSVQVIPASINELLEKNNLELNDIKHVVFHQANQYMLKELQKRMKLTNEQMIIDMEMIGNTVSSTIPIALKNLISNGSLEKGELILLSGFGVGLSWGNVLYKYI
ncbi:MAG: ketoacyl-ACP synthase III [Candidatus Kapabacteria bacterium]|nr:ketoacyl-ACP synthase III [Candidatus Kapabacteria bacterium]